MLKRLITYKRCFLKLGLAAFFLLFFSNLSNAQVGTDTNNVDSTLTTPPQDSTTTTNPAPVDSTSSDSIVSDTNVIVPNSMNAFFMKREIELLKGQVVSNVLHIINKTETPQVFKTDILYPAGWMNLSDDSVYTMQPEEERFIPIILIPKSLLNSNTEIMINVFLVDSQNIQLATNYFSLFTQKQISWKATVSPGSRLYFRNGETKKSFDYTIMNTGNFKQDILVSQKTNNGDIFLRDSNNLIITDEALTLSLGAGQDTTLSFNATTADFKARNFKRLSIYSHNPNANLDYKKYSVFINSTEPKSIGKTGYHKGNKVDLIKLPNARKVTPFGYPNLPLTVEANIQNILSDYTFMSLNMRGFKQITPDASLSYYAQINYSQSYFSTTAYQSIPWYIGYFDKRTTVEIGQVSGNLIGIYNVGKGIKASYKYFDRHKTMAFYVRDPQLFKTPRTESFGLGHTFKMNENFKVTGKIGRGINYLNNTTIDVVTLNPSFNIKKRHFISFVGAVSNRSVGTTIPPNNTQGFMLGGNYSTYFFNRKVKTTINGRYSNPEFSYGVYERLSANHRTTITATKKWDIYVNNVYQRMTSFGINGFYQEMLFNNVIFSTTNRYGTFQPGIYYNITDLLSNRVHSRGLSIRYSKFNFQKNVLTSFFVKGGYNDPIDFNNRPDYFTLEMSSLIRYRTWNLIAKYNYGALSTNAYFNMQNEGITPQALRLSIQNQYQFKNTHFIMQNALRYNYNNRFNGHNFGVFTEMYYFTNSGWRYGARLNYSLSSANYTDLYDTYNLNQGNLSRGASVNQNINLGVSVKKDFGIPIPFAKKRHATNQIIAFYDVNGNNIKDDNEPVMENVIVSINAKEVITNKKGVAELANMPIGTYSFSVMALDKMEGWFPSTSDSISIINSGTIYVPYVRGVKVYGDVVLDRQKIAVADKDKVFDLSRIKITAAGGKTYYTLTDIDGHFEFYLPNGNYTLTMDESILGNTYKLSRNNLPLNLKTSQDGVYMSFYIVEKRRKVNFKEF